MFALSNAKNNIRRHSRKSLLYLLVCIIAVLMLHVYMSGIYANEAQLLRLPGALPISARVSNLDASRYTGLQITEKTVNGLIDSSFVQNLQMAALLGGWVGNSPDDYREKQTGYIVGVNTIAVIEGLEDESVAWLTGYSSGLFGSDEAVCIADSGLMRRHGWALGDSVSINIYYYRYGEMGQVYYEQIGELRTLIAGEADLTAVATNMVAPRIILPFETVRSIYRERDIAFTAASASFFVGDALNINDFKTEMATLDLRRFTPGYDVSKLVLANQGTALLVNDAAFISTATRLQETISLFRGFLPLMAIALASIGYFVGYLMIQNRRAEYAVFRLLGVSKRRSTGMYLAEIAALTLAGSLSGSIAAISFGISSFEAGFIVFVLFSALFLLGGATALYRHSRTNIMFALARTD